MLNTICGRYALTEQKRELTLVKELVRAMRLANPGVRALQVHLALNTVKIFTSFGVKALKHFLSIQHRFRERISFHPNPIFQDQIEEDDVMRWAATLSRARVTRYLTICSLFGSKCNFTASIRWGGMISTPDAVLQAMIKRSLQESGCPVHIGDLHLAKENH